MAELYRNKLSMWYLQNREEPTILAPKYAEKTMVYHERILPQNNGQSNNIWCNILWHSIRISSLCIHTFPMVLRFSRTVLYQTHPDSSDSGCLKTWCKFRSGYPNQQTFIQSRIFGISIRILAEIRLNWVAAVKFAPNENYWITKSMNWGIKYFKVNIFFLRNEAQFDAFYNRDHQLQLWKMANKLIIRTSCSLIISSLDVYVFSPKSKQSVLRNYITAGVIFLAHIGITHSDFCCTVISS